ncbi:hypothetical protein [Gordonia sp. ABSL49_1]|uniref:hypothetical protein n=1 Tax=Gordonia sp. ABSL49_1 TaxID=2920941 RepID=UPI001F0D1AA4|nr:hypothetical protein [Gordonia sp. ABSL49_1]MCH5641221.1 hypothetical protein [Gordonia sp. ABSL49_1]
MTTADGGEPTSTASETPDDAREKVDELESRHLDTPSPDDADQVDPASAQSDREDNPDAPEAGAAEPPD